MEVKISGLVSAPTHRTTARHKKNGKKLKERKDEDRMKAVEGLHVKVRDD